MIKYLPGCVYATPDEMSAAFLDAEDCFVLRDVIGQVIDDPTTSRKEFTLDLGVLREIQELLSEPDAPVAEDAPPVILSAAQAIYLQLTIEQLSILASLVSSQRIKFNLHAPSVPRNGWTIQNV